VNDLVQVLKEVRALLAVSAESDWAALTPAEVMMILNREILALETTGRIANAVELTSLFAPSAEVQEISMANGWSERYLELSSQFDAAIGSRRPR
jgi:hypothetical protein